MSLCWIARAGSEVHVGANNLDTATLLLARKLRIGRVRRVLYFASDFSDVRFDGLLNRVYRAIEIYCLRHADLVISNTHRAAQARLALGLTAARSLVVPNGVDLDIPTPARQLLARNFVYVGSVTKEHGLFELVAALGPHMDALTVIGDGDDWDRVEALCVSEAIPATFMRRRTHQFVLEFLSTFQGWGLAPYNASSRWTVFCSPLKVVEYVACGVPVIVSGVPEIAEIVLRDQVGIASDDADSTLLSRLDAFPNDGFHDRAQAFAAAYSAKQLYGLIPL